MRQKLDKYPLVLFLAALLFLSSCSEEKKVKIPPPAEDAATVSFEAEKTDNLASREALFIYTNKSPASKNLVLKFGNGPFLLSSGYVRLAGLVWGKRPAACLELGGKGLVLLEGGEVDDYRVVRIGNDSVVLKKKDEK